MHFQNLNRLCCRKFARVFRKRTENVFRKWCVVESSCEYVTYFSKSRNLRNTLAASFENPGQVETSCHRPPPITTTLRRYLLYFFIHVVSSHPRQLAWAMSWDPTTSPPEFESGGDVVSSRPTSQLNIIGAKVDSNRVQRNIYLYFLIDTH